MFTYSERGGILICKVSICWSIARLLISTKDFALNTYRRNTHTISSNIASCQRFLVALEPRNVPLPMCAHKITRSTFTADTHYGTSSPLYCVQFLIKSFKVLSFLITSYCQHLDQRCGHFPPCQ